MKTKSFIGIIINLFVLLALLSCGQKAALKGEKPQEEAVTIETNQIFTTEDTVESSNRMKVLILPLIDRSDHTKYPNAKIVNTILMNELYAFLYIEPSFAVPEKTTLTEMDSSFLYQKNLDPKEIYNQYQADIVIYGDYSLMGIKSDPQAQIHLNIWQKPTGKIVTNLYKTPIDTDIFDTIETMLSQIINTTLDEDIKIAFLNFGNIKVGNGAYSLIINNKMAAKITNDNFAMNLKIVPNAVYMVKLRNLSDNKIVLNTPVIVKPGESTNISYSALGNIICTMRKKIPGEDYQIFLDGKKILLNEVLSNIPAGREYSVKVVDSHENEYTEKYYLSDGQFKNLILPQKKMLLFDITNEKITSYSVYHGLRSKVEINTNRNEITEGRNSFSADFNDPYDNVNNAYAGIQVHLNYDKMDWTGMDTFKIWIFGRKTDISYFMTLVDKWEEQFIYWFTDDWKGWKQITIPLDHFWFRTRYQSSTAKINNKIDYPLSALEFQMNLWDRSTSVGVFRLTIGEMEVTRE